MKGRLDLVERHPQLGFRVVDHKTGRSPDEGSPESIGRGEVLQPAIYALAAEQFLSETVSVGRLFYSTLRANYTTFDIPIHELTRDSRGLVMTTKSRSTSAWVRKLMAPAPRVFDFNKTDILLRCGPVCGSKWLILGWDMRAGLFSNVALRAFRARL